MLRGCSSQCWELMWGHWEALGGTGGFWEALGGLSWAHVCPCVGASCSRVIGSELYHSLEERPAPSCHVFPAVR